MGRRRRERDRTVLEQLRSKLVFRNSFDAVWRVSQNRHAPTNLLSGCTPGGVPVRVSFHGVGIEDENDQVS